MNPAIEVSLDEAITLLTPRLRIASVAAVAATQLLERLRLGMEDEVSIAIKTPMKKH